MDEPRIVAGGLPQQYGDAVFSALRNHLRLWVFFRENVGRASEYLVFAGNFAKKLQTSLWPQK